MNETYSDEAQEVPGEGAFVASLKRNNRQIKADRAASIAEDAQVTYRRYIEDLELKVKRLHRDRENMLDMSPDNKMSLILAADFDAPEYVSREASIAMDIRNTEIKLELMRERYDYLFGGAA